MFCLDSSVAVAAVSAETATAAVLEWMAGREDILISDWLVTEAVAALSRKHRMQFLSAEEHAGALAALRQQIGGALPALPVTREDFRVAARLAERPDTGLRAGDALHLAIASSAGATLATLDRGQARAAWMLQIPALLLG